MKRVELRESLKLLGIPSRIYSLNGSQTDERVCLYEHAGEWRVSFFERGKEKLLGSFSDESKACEFMLNELKQEV